MLDEPTNHLDPGREELLSLVKIKGLPSAVLHDLTLTESFANRGSPLVVGATRICDTPEKVLASEYLYPVFGLTSFTVPHPHTVKGILKFRIMYKITFAESQ